MNALVLALFFMIATAVDGAAENNTDRRFGKTSGSLTDKSSNTEAAAKTSLIEENIFNSTVSVETLPSKFNNEDKSPKSKFITEMVHMVDAANNTELSETTKSTDQRAWNLLNDMKIHAVKTNNTLLLSLLDKIMKKNDLKLFFNTQKSIKTDINDILLYTIRKQMENIAKNSSDALNGNNHRKDKNIKNTAEFKFQKQNIKRIVSNKLPIVKEDRMNNNIPRNLFQARNNSDIADNFTSTKDNLNDYDKKIKAHYLRRQVFRLEENNIHLKNETPKFNEKHFINILSTLKIRDMRKFAEILINKSALKYRHLGQNKYNEKHFLERENNTNTSYDHDDGIPAHFQLRNIKKRELKSNSKKNKNNDKKRNATEDKQNRNRPKKPNKPKKPKDKPKKPKDKPPKQGGLGDIITDTLAHALSKTAIGFMHITTPIVVGNIYKYLMKTNKLGDWAYFNVIYAAMGILAGGTTGPTVVLTGVIVFLAARAFDRILRNRLTEDVLIKAYKLAVEKFDEHIGIFYVLRLMADAIQRWL